jgi:hypothetical protein
MPEVEHRRQVAAHDEVAERPERCRVDDGVLDRAGGRSGGEESVGVYPAAYRTADEAVDELLVAAEVGVLGDPIDGYPGDVDAQADAVAVVDRAASFDDAIPLPRREQAVERAVALMPGEQLLDGNRDRVTATEGVQTDSAGTAVSSVRTSRSRSATSSLDTTPRLLTRPSA